MSENHKITIELTDSNVVKLTSVVMFIRRASGIPRMPTQGDAINWLIENIPIDQMRQELEQELKV
jgi:hypothetical protein